MIKLYNNLLIGYSILNLIMMILLKLNLITYGDQLTNSILFLIFLGTLLLSVLLRLAINKSKNTLQTIFITISSIFILFMLYFLFEDCRITNNI